MKFKRGQLVRDTRNIEGGPCIVLGHEVLAWAHEGDSIYYKVYMIERQRTICLMEDILSPINPQGGS